MARKHTEISLKDKMFIINQLAKGRDNSEVAKEFNTNKSTISFIYENRNLILNTLISWNMKTLRRTKYYKLNKAILIYFRQAIAFNEFINGPIIKAKANSLSKKLGLKDFVATDNWLTRFKMRYCINFSTLWCFESRTFPPITEQYLSDDEIVQRVKDTAKGDTFEDDTSIAINKKGIPMYSAEDDQSEDDEMQVEVENKENEVQEEIKNLLCEEERKEDQNCDSSNASLSWMKDIKIIINDNSAENAQGSVINALKIVNNTLNSFDIVPNDVINAFTLIETFIKKEISGDNNI